ncbi:hypothetical protein [uncultured Thiohalocapsa sp.]|uniref:hypothetical protein n=1 Tax=uncultured Thiohalocapsa sp. TaxID=768990 RepID=UPI0025F406CF|nr:hypothetical protein [uncultured Thiohalocapsa sp.]
MLCSGIRFVGAAAATVVLLAAPLPADDRGSGASPPLGHGPGAGHDLRRNLDLPGLGYPWRRPAVPPLRGLPPHRGSAAGRRRDPVTGLLVPRRGYGVGRPGWRGRGPYA